jgi:hypothetical protein
VRRLILVFVVVAVLGLLTRLVLKSYSLDLVHVVVMNAVAQKAPDDFPKSKVYDTFSECLEQVKESPTEDRYLQHLLTLSHHLEKVHYLEEKEVEELLKELTCN